MRGQKEVEKLLKVKKARKGKGTASQAIVEDSEDEDEEDLDEDEFDDEVVMREMGKGKGKRKEMANTELGDTWHALSDSSDSDTGSIVSTISQSQSQNKPAYQAIGSKNKLKTVIEDSDWDDADIID